MPSKRQARSAKRLKNIKKQKGKFPELLTKVVETSEIILEILDARFIHDTRNIEAEEFIKAKGKKIIYVLNKTDMIDVDKVKKTKYLKEIRPYVFVSCKTRKGGKDLRDRIKFEAKRILKDQTTYKRAHVGVVGYPNAGKSSVINLLIGKASAKTGAEAGFTKGLQKLRLTADILLLDSPGVIPPSEYSAIDISAISKHAKINARDFGKIKDPEIAVSKLINEFPKQFAKYYEIKEKDSEEFIVKFGKKKRILKKGGKIDEDNAARMMLKDWQEGKIKI